MPRRIFPASSVTNTTGAPLRLTFHYTQTGGVRASDLWTVDGSNYVSAGIPNGIVLTDVSGNYSAFAGPDDVDTLWVTPHTGAARTQITATGTVANGSTVDDSTYAPKASPTFTGTLQMTSTGAGGTSINPTSDTTGHIVVPSYQTNSSVSALSPGEGIRLQVMNSIAKNMIAWQMPRPLASGGVETLKSTVWIGAHYFDQNDGTTVHGHWSLETPDSGDSLRTRLEVKICDASGTLVDKTLVQTSSADFVVDASNSQVLRVRSGAGAARNIEWANDQWGTNPRWRVGVPSDAGETGSNVGSDLAVYRFNDSNTQVDDPLRIKRSNGQVTLGGSTGTGAGVVVNRASAGNAVSVVTNLTGGTGAIAYNHNALDSTSRTIQANITSDTNFRFVLFADGKHEWGAGATTRDVNLYRSGADILKTDDALVVTDALTVKTKAGAVADGDFLHTPPDGTIAVDTTNSKIYARIGGTWKSVTVA